MNISGGYILKPRCGPDAVLLDKPPLWTKLFGWMLLKAHWRGSATLERGQLIASIEEMRAAMAWMVGYRRVTPSRDDIRSSYEGLAKARLIATSRTIHGMLITICDYSYYQNPASYGPHAPAAPGPAAKPAPAPRLLREEEKQKSPSGQAPQPDFEAFWNAYPRKKSKGTALKAWMATAARRPALERVLAAVEAAKAGHGWQKDGGRYIPYPATWLNALGWEDAAPDACPPDAMPRATGLSLEEYLARMNGHGESGDDGCDVRRKRQRSGSGMPDARAIPRERGNAEGAPAAATGAGGLRRPL